MAVNNGLELWVHDIHKDIVSLGLKVTQTLFSGQSRFQQIDIVESKGLGKVLLNDGLFMLSEADEFIYHEMIAHVPMFVHPSPKRVLIIGGGDGGTAREVLKHAVIKVVMVEIDEMVVNACREYIPSVSCAMNDPRLEIIIADGVKYAAETREKFDIVIIDSTDPIGPATPLFDSAFYQNVSKILTDDGIMISQAESPFYDNDIQTSMFKNQRPFFQKLFMYLLTNMTYPGGLWGFGFASKGLCPIKNLKPERLQSSGLSFKYYNEKIHHAAFALPTFIAENLKGIVDLL